MSFLEHKVPIAAWNAVAALKGSRPVSVESIVIPCAGADYTGEASLAAKFAQRSLPGLKEVIIVTDQPAGSFSNLPSKARVETLSGIQVPKGPYSQIWKSRIIKLKAPLLARHSVILLMDSDMNLLRDFQVRVRPGAVFGSFRKGKLSYRVKSFADKIPELKESARVDYKAHLNGAFLLAHRDTWQALSPEWLKLFEHIWPRSSMQEPPTDQLPLCIALDRLRLKTVNLGFWVNWSVAKNMGGRSEVIPQEVIGAHGGFPLSEWDKYLADPRAPLTFEGQDYTRRERYKPKSAE